MDVYIGTIFAFGGTFAPRDYSFCNGATLPISSNAALFSILGTFYGGNGTTTFALPNLNGRVAIGTGSGAGLTSRTIGQSFGTETVSLNTSHLPSHTHAANGLVLNAVSATGSTITPTGNYLAASRAASSAAYIASAVAPATVVALNSGSVSGTIGSAGAASPIPISVRQPVLAMSYIICLYGIFPTRN